MEANGWHLTPDALDGQDGPGLSKVAPEPKLKLASALIDVSPGSRFGLHLKSDHLVQGGEFQVELTCGRGRSVRFVLVDWPSSAQSKGRSPTRPGLKEVDVWFCGNGKMGVLAENSEELGEKGVWAWKAIGEPEGEEDPLSLHPPTLSGGILVRVFETPQSQSSKAAGGPPDGDEVLQEWIDLRKGEGETSPEVDLSLRPSPYGSRQQVEPTPNSHRLQVVDEAPQSRKVVATFVLGFRLDPSPSSARPSSSEPQQRAPQPPTPPMSSKSKTPSQTYSHKSHRRAKTTPGSSSTSPSTFPVATPTSRPRVASHDPHAHGGQKRAGEQDGSPASKRPRGASGQVLELGGKQAVHSHPSPTRPAKQVSVPSSSSKQPSTSPLAPSAHKRPSSTRLTSAQKASDQQNGGGNSPPYQEFLNYGNTGLFESVEGDVGASVDGDGRPVASVSEKHEARDDDDGLLLEGQGMMAKDDTASVDSVGGTDGDDHSSDDVEMVQEGHVDSTQATRSHSAPSEPASSSYDHGHVRERSGEKHGEVGRREVVEKHDREGLPEGWEHKPEKGRKERENLDEQIKASIDYALKQASFVVFNAADKRFPAISAPSFDDLLQSEQRAALQPAFMAYDVAMATAAEAAKTTLLTEIRKSTLPSTTDEALSYLPTLSQLHLDPARLSSPPNELQTTLHRILTNGTQDMLARYLKQMEPFILSEGLSVETIKETNQAMMENTVRGKMERELRAQRDGE